MSIEWLKQYLLWGLFFLVATLILAHGLFPEKVLERFIMKFEIEAEAGDHVMTTNHGEGILLLHLGNSNWNVKLSDGREIVLNERQFKLL